MNKVLDFFKLLIEATVALYILAIFAFTLIPAITTSTNQSPIIFWVLILVTFFSILIVLVTQVQKVFFE